MWNVTKKQFQAYESVRDSGVTNMFDTKVVSSISKLSRPKIIEIIQNYKEIVEK